MYVGLIAASYLIGSLPVAWVVTRLVTGQDLRRMGTGNAGVMNVAVSTARWAGLLVFLAEAAKGVLAVMLGGMVAASADGDDSDLAMGLALLAAVAGTRWSIWLRFAGGRGNTLALAGLAVISWLSVLAGLGLWIVARVVSRNSFRATRIALALWPVAIGFVTRSGVLALVGVAASLMTLTTHRLKTDDHQLIKATWPSLWAFLTAPPRRATRRNLEK